MTTIDTNVKTSAIRELDKLALQRRANANITSATAWTFIGGLFATVPISIRQRDWKIWALPFVAGMAMAFIGYDASKEEFHPVTQLLALGTQAGLAGAFIKQNKDEAKITLSGEEIA